MEAKELVALLRKYPDFKHTTDGATGAACCWTRCVSAHASVCTVNEGQGSQAAAYSKANGELDVILLSPYVLEHKPTNEDELLLVKVGGFFYFKL